MTTVTEISYDGKIAFLMRARNPFAHRLLGDADEQPTMLPIELCAHIFKLGRTVTCGSVLSLARSCPLPEAEEANWYDWQCDNWGTKWDVDDAVFVSPPVDAPEGSIQYTFLTAWSPPAPWLRKVALKYKALTFQLAFSECGMDFSGCERFKDGALVEQRAGNYGEWHGHISDDEYEESEHGHGEEVDEHTEELGGVDPGDLQLY